MLLQIRSMRCLLERADGLALFVIMLLYSGLVGVPKADATTTHFASHSRRRATCAIRRRDEVRQRMF